MKIISDTDVLVRSVMRDDAKQARAADRILRQATVIAHEGLQLGGEVFVSFDKNAVALLSDMGQSASLLK